MPDDDEGIEDINGFMDGEITSNEDGDAGEVDECMTTNGGELLLRGISTFVAIVCINRGFNL